MKINWSKKSLDDYENILDYLVLQRSKKEFKSLTEGVEKALEHIAKKPSLYPIVDLKVQEVRKAVITKRTSMFYKSDQGAIEILAFFDTRQDPDKLTIS